MASGWPRSTFTIFINWVGIGRAVALAFAREGADVLISYLNEQEDAKEIKRLVEDAGRKAVLVEGDIQHAKHCRAIVDQAVKRLGGIDILVNNAAYQATFKDIADISDEEWELTFRVNIHAMFYQPGHDIRASARHACLTRAGGPNAGARAAPRRRARVRRRSRRTTPRQRRQSPPIRQRKRE
jgi:NAD(P)-dependent dehydrogenase (short-subunit alcohol dehydrogenase family)